MGLLNSAARRILPAVALLMVVGAVGCTAGSSADSAPAPGTTSADDSPRPLASEFGEEGAPGCAPASPIVGDEVMGTATTDDGSAYGLLLGPFRDSTLFAGSEPFKLVVRLAGGDGGLQVRLHDPDGAVLKPEWGPEDHHGSSNYARPGDEWGMGLGLSRAGCWRVELIRDAGTAADFWLEVQEPV